MTLTLIARNPYTRQIGLAMASGSEDCVEGSIAFDEKVGVLSVQGKGDRSLRDRLFEQMREGVSASDILSQAAAEDSLFDLRQIVIVPFDGEIGVHTGSQCLLWAGHVKTENYILAGNMLANADVLQNMERAYLKDMHALKKNRLLAALKEGIAAGGDLRGHKSAGIIVVGYQPFDLRVVDQSQVLNWLDEAALP